MGITTTKKSILDTIVESRKGHYIHVVEVSDVYELENIAECIVQEYEHTHTTKEIIEFLDSLEVYFLGDCSELEKEVYNFSFNEFIKGAL